MKIAVLADIHGNLEAFEAVVVDLGEQGVDRVFCLGDNIGYGPDPEEVVARLRQLHYESVLGNHEFALGDSRGRRWLNFEAAQNNIDTEQLLSEGNRQFCRNLPPFLTWQDAYFVHAFPPDSVFRYLNRQSDDKIAALFASTLPQLFFVGHTHHLALIIWQQGMITREPLSHEKVVLLPEEKYIVNCGSVGQPRDEDRRAKYLVWDAAAGELFVRRVEYDYRKTMKKIRDRGFPEIYASRLA